MIDYFSVLALTSLAEEKGVRISDIVLADQEQQMETTQQKLYERMEQSLSVMEEAVYLGKAKDLKSISGLSGSDGFKMELYAIKGGISGSFVNHAITKAIAVAEYNAAMGKIVASPTAGACGILPACIITMGEEHSLKRDDIVMSMFTAGAMGMVIANKASISGAQGGCQAECGSAAAMAAAALVELAGGSPTQVANAAAIAIKNQLGLVCDPVAGLVEIPCIKRNAGGVSIAISAAEMALAGIESKIPVDEVIEAMDKIGRAIPEALRETSLGGLATTPTGIRLRKQVFGE